MWEGNRQGKGVVVRNGVKKRREGKGRGSVERSEGGVDEGRGS